MSKLSAKGISRAFERQLEILKILLDKEMSYLEIQKETRMDYGAVIRYISSLEANGLVRVEPVMNKNVVRLTERGKCIAKCLVE